mgnify:CR=1 FL=1
MSVTDGACAGAGGSCTFETSMCTWMNTQTGDDFDWLRQQGTTDTVSTGPRGDHTIGTFVGTVEKILPFQIDLP